MAVKFHAVLLGGCIALSTSVSHAAIFDWNNPAGGSFIDPANWTGAGVQPGSGDIAEFDIDATYTVDFPSNRTNLNAIVHRGDVTFDLSGNTYTLTTTNSPGSPPTPGVNQASLTVGDNAGDLGALTVLNGTLGNYHGLIGSQSGSEGTLTIGSGGSLSSGGVLYNGYYGTGTVNVIDGGRLQRIHCSLLDSAMAVSAT